MRSWKSESGQVLVLTALSMMMLLGFMGLATDIGQMFHARRSLQIAADDAAISGALAYKYANQAGASSSATTSEIQSAASKALSLNGVSNATISTTYSSSVTSPTLFLASPPVDGPNQGTSGFVEAILTVPQSTMFMSIFGFTSMNIMTRAVAGPGGNSKACFYVLNPTGESTYMGGKFTVDAPGCGIAINSSDECALSFNGGGQGQSSTLTAGWVEVNGGACKQIADSNPAPTTNTGVKVSDPLQNIVNFPKLTDCSGTNGKIDFTTTISATYTPTTDIVCFPNTVTIKGTGTSGSCTSSSYLYLNTAIYVFEKGVIFNGGCIATGTGGATFDLYGYYTQGGTDYSMTVTTQTSFLLNSPTTDTPGCSWCSDSDYGNASILIEQPSTNYLGVININQGNSVGAIGTIEGIIYAPTAELLFTDQGASSSTGVALTLTTDLVVGSFYDQASNVTINSLQSSGNPTPLTHVTLVE
jgi:hypothetical protein